MLMKLKCFIPLSTVILIVGTFVAPVLAQYNPSTDNPYVKAAGSDSKKWYEFYKEEKSPSPYTQKPSGYWRSAKEENIVVKGAKWVGTTVKEILQAAING